MLRPMLSFFWQLFMKLSMSISCLTMDQALQSQEKEHLFLDTLMVGFSHVMLRGQGLRYFKIIQNNKKIVNVKWKFLSLNFWADWIDLIKLLWNQTIKKYDFLFPELWRSRLSVSKFWMAFNCIWRLNFFNRLLLCQHHPQDPLERQVTPKDSHWCGRAWRGPPLPGNWMLKVFIKLKL